MSEHNKYWNPSLIFNLQVKFNMIGIFSRLKPRKGKFMSGSLWLFRIRMNANFEAKPNKT